MEDINLTAKTAGLKIVDKLTQTQDLTDEELKVLLLCEDEQVIQYMAQQARAVREKYYGKDGKVTIEKIYNEVIGAQRDRVDDFKETILETFRQSRDSFEELPEGEEKEFLQLFAFICDLSFDVYVKKLMIEKIIDGYTEKHEAERERRRAAAGRPSGEKRDKKH